MIRAHFTMSCLYLAQEKIVDRLNIPSLDMLLHLIQHGLLKFLLGMVSTKLDAFLHI